MGGSTEESAKSRKQISIGFALLELHVAVLLTVFDFTSYPSPDFVISPPSKIYTIVFSIVCLPLIPEMC